MDISSINCIVPGWSSFREQTTGSLITRVILAALGAIALTIGILIFCHIPGLSSVGSMTGWICMTAGGMAILAGMCLRCVKNSINERKKCQVEQKSEYLLEKKRINTEPAKVENKHQHIDFSKITPANIESHLDLTQRFDLDTAKKGDLVFTKCIHDEDYTSCRGPAFSCKKGDTYLTGVVAYTKLGGYWGADLEIQNGKFIHFPQMSAPAVYFQNLQEFLNYLLKGAFYQGNCIQGMEFFTLRAVDGTEICYDNPYKN